MRDFIVYSPEGTRIGDGKYYREQQYRVFSSSGKLIWKVRLSDDKKWLQFYDIVSQEHLGFSLIEEKEKFYIFFHRKTYVGYGVFQ